MAFAIALLLGLLLTLVVYAFFPTIIAVFLISAVVTYALVPLADLLERQGLNRTAGVALAGLAGLGAVTVVVLLMAPTVSEQVQQLPDAIGRMVDRVGQIWDSTRTALPDVVIDTTERVVGGVWQEVSNFQGTGGGVLARYAGTAASGVTAVATSLILVPVFTFLMLRGYHHFIGGMLELVPYRWRPRFKQRTGEVDVVLSGFIRGQLTICAILVVLYGIAFSIIGVPLALLIAFLGGLGELIPYVGNVLALSLGMLLAFAGGSPMDVVWVAVAYLAIQGLQSAVISPYVMGRRVSLSPVTIIVALAIGGQILGFMGLLFAVPAAALLKVGARSALSSWRLSGFYRKTPG